MGIRNRKKGSRKTTGNSTGRTSTKTTGCKTTRSTGGKKNGVKSFAISTMAIMPLILAGCGSGMMDASTIPEDTDSLSGSSTDNDAAAVAFVGGGSTETLTSVEGSERITSEAGADINAKIFNVVTDKVEEEIEAQIRGGEINEALLEYGENSELVSKDVRIGFGSRGLGVFIEDEKIPFAGGTMILNGEIGLKLRYLGGGKIWLLASGELTSTLDGVKRSGIVRDVPYSLELVGTNDIETDGSLTMTIKRWKVKGMSASLTNSIVSSDVTALGMIGDKEARGSVDMVDMSITLSNDNILENPAAVNVTCAGTITTEINDNIIGVCAIDENCLKCE